MMLANSQYRWATNPTEDQDLVAVDSTGAELDNLCSASNKTATVTAGGASPSVTDGTSSATASASPSAISNISVPAIVGGVVGGVAGIAALSLVAWLLSRGRQRTNDPRISEIDTNYTSELGADAALRDSSKLEARGSRLDSVHELAQSAPLFHELLSRGYEDGRGYWRGNLPRYELPGESEVIHEMLKVEGLGRWPRLDNFMLSVHLYCTRN